MNNLELLAVRTPAAGGGRRPKVGFLGLGWIARHRLKALRDASAAEVVALADPYEPALQEAQALAPEARCGSSLDWLLEQALDGVVISTPSALHAEQATAALEQGLAVFCQKPLARTRQEAALVIEAARLADRLLGVDFSYRQAAGVRQIRNRIREGELGLMYAADLVFHHAYGPDKLWYRTRDLSGGGCVIDLGIHLIDLLLWVFSEATAEELDSRLFSGGMRMELPAQQIEDYASIRLDLSNGVSARMTCSWNLSAGRDCVIGATFYGTRGAMSLENLNGSFYDLRVEEYKGTGRVMVQSLDNQWGGRALQEWARRLGTDPRYEPEVESVLEVAAVIDAIYGRRTRRPPPVSAATEVSSEGRRAVMAKWLSNLHNLNPAGLRIPS